MKDQNKKILKLILLSLVLASIILYFLYNPNAIIAQLILLVSIIALLLAPFLLLSFLQRFATTCISIGLVSGAIGIKLVDLNTNYGSLGKMDIGNHWIIPVCAFIVAVICLYFDNEKTKSTNAKIKIKKEELQKAVKQINEIQSSKPFAIKPTGYVPNFKDLFNFTLSTHNRYSEIFNSYAQYVSGNKTSKLRELKKEIDNKVGTIGAQTYSRITGTPLNESNQQMDLNGLNSKISKFNSDVADLFNKELELINDQLN